MKKDFLSNALRLGQLITLLAPLANANKAFSKKLGKLRSAVHEQVVMAAYLKSETAAYRKVDGNLNEVLSTLQASMLTYLDIKALLKRSETERSIQLAHVVKVYSAETGARLFNVDQRLLEAVLNVKFDTASGARFSQEFRGDIIRAYCSAVRNSSWRATLMRLELSLEASSDANKALMHAHGSNQGREMLAERLKKLCPTYFDESTAKARGKKAAVTPLSAEGLYSNCVQFNTEALLSQSQIAELVDITVPQSGEPAGTSLPELLAKLTKPMQVPQGTPVATFAQACLDELVRGLQARRKAIEQVRAKDRRKATENAKAQAIEALQSLNPKLLKVLKDNPDILKTV